MLRSCYLASLILVASPLWGAITEHSQVMAQAVGLPVFTNAAGIAIQGTDPVAYFTLGEPTPGMAEFSYTWMDATWYFSSAAHRDAFIANPEAYAPQYGGYCAYAVANGYTASIDPAAWRIVDDRLYLNFSTGVQRRWERDISGHIEQADRNWPSARADFRR
ncbi:MAG: YHS domain protein [Synechococcaceae cyanobacterium SM2_3_60]|nr:YHS domain protein [Synechococcaceae cyanobacterium SM2_3_60]